MAESADEHSQTRASGLRDVRGGILDLPDQLLDVEGTLRRNQAVLSQVTTDCVDELGALANQDVASPEDHCGGLLGLALHGYEPHGLALRGLTDRLGIGRIVLLPLDERLHVSRRNHLHPVAKLADLSTPVMRAGASLHRYEAGRLGGEEGQYLIAPQLLAEDRHTGGIWLVRLEDVLSQIQADDVNLCRGRPPLVVHNTTILARRYRRERPPHHYKTTTLVAGLRLSGLAAPFVLEGLINRDAFKANVDRVLVPELTSRRHHPDGQPQQPQGPSHARGD